MRINKEPKRWSRLGVCLLLVSFIVGTGSVGNSNANAQQSQREVRVAIRVLEPFVNKTSDGRYSGFSIDLWEEVARRNDFRTTYVEVASVNELLDAVRTGKADAATTAISMTSEREKSVDFSVPMFNSGLQIAVPESHAHETGGLWQTLGSPAIVQLLLLMFSSILVAAVIVWLIERRDNPDFAHSGAKGVFEGVWWAVVTLFTVGYGDRVTKSSAGRAFSMLFMMYGVLLIAAFTATFAASLTVRDLQTDITSISDLGRRKVATVKGTTSADYLRTHNIAAEEVDSVDEMLKRASSGTVDAIVYDAPVLAFAARSGNGSPIQLVGAPLTREYYGIALPQGSDIGSPIDISLLNIYEDGTYVRIYDSWFVR